MRSPHNLGTRIFVIGGLILFGVGVFFITNRQRLFNQNFEVYTEFDRLNGLQKGAKVRVSGMEAGEVLETQIPSQPDGRFRLKMRLGQNVHVLVRTDSVASIQTMGLAGSTFLDITKGTSGAPEAPRGATLLSKEPFDMAALMQQGSAVLKTAQASITDLQTSGNRTLESINAAAQHTDQTIVAVRPELQAIVASIQKTSEDIRTLVAQVKKGQGTVGELLTDQQLVGSVNETIENVRQSSVNLNHASARASDTMTDFQRRELLARAQAILDNTRQVTEQLNQAIASFTSSPAGDQSSAADLRGAIESSRRTMDNLAADTEALKHNFFLRGFFKRRGYYNLQQMTPAQYRTSKFVKGNASDRVWLQAYTLFSAASDGAEILTQAGQAQIDAAMSALVPYLPNSPVVVEGYATQGSPSERFLRAKQRATAVQGYIEKRYGLQPHMVAVMPMSDKAPLGAGKSVWDGVSLVLIR